MKNMTLDNVAKACGGALHLPEGGHRKEDFQEASCVVIDSRKIEPGGIFIATKGEKVDGHRFIGQVTEGGALGVVCEREEKDCPVPYILVKDSFQALKDIAEFYRRQLSVKVVGVTGSVGKTSTKEFIASVLSARYRVLKTSGNFNNEIGLPLTVLSIRQEHEIAVLEMGISDFGEMHRLSKIAKPDICVLTNIGQSHLEKLGSREGILKAKSEIFDYMNSEGYVFVNGDDDMLRHIKKKGNHEPIHFGLKPENEIFASDVFDKGLFGSQAVIHANLEVFQVEIPLPGIHMVLNALAAAGVGMQLGLTAEDVKQGIANVEAVRGRSNVLSLSDCTLIDDCYNANPGSMQAAIDLLSMASGRKVAILGDMFELGEGQEQLHGDVGAYAVKKKIDVLICTGKLSGHMYEQAVHTREAADAQEKKEIYHFAERDEMIQILPKLLKKGDTILVKASHGMEFEKVVEFLVKRDN
ncbi:UDP-N-acetylmuramoyl-tripeptide--D-alanyl-D-alanine ligase [Parablautia muri]|uniref:UDP-N-acetylmuramoyl-tripeptide--D-alanyl-D-alanine ligase n=1 Tax=Parablautia muri TaxID=2320879 RepID=A0A9X5BDC4_9FIRM|nr:UDP-N-acetylmuramoyl-tripeptide--D-alanyl-D-alanine ligase [Parablautia muri]NBJ91906.1 UDP-N-acetylmuramoyl-tripeptide--D-alanyl-D-alanine ligase [Parablautia muri]